MRARHFAGGAKHWKPTKSAKVDDGVLRIRLDPKKSVRIQQTFSGIPNDAIQFQAFFRVQLAEGSSISKPLMLRMGPNLGEGELLIDAAVLFAHPDGKDKRTWSRIPTSTAGSTIFESTTAP